MQPFNKYYPPDWTPDKGTVNQYTGKHPYGDRARKIDQGILVVRFELPFNIWCTGCDNHIGRGVRYNAEKKQIGKYYSTPILQFRMKCHLCSQWIEIHTDPKNAAYVVVSGARQKVETWTADKEDHVIALNDEEIKEKLAEDPIYRLEHGLQDKVVGLSNVPVLTKLQQLNDSQWKDPYTQSQQLRRKFREEKKKELQLQEQANQLKDKHSLHIDLLPESETDAMQAKLVDFSESGRLRIDQQKLEKTAASLFSAKPIKPAKTLTSSCTSSALVSTNHTSTKENGINSASATLGQKAVLRTKLKTDPFLQNIGFKKRITTSKETAANDTTLSSSSSSPSSSSSSAQHALHGITVRPAKRKKSDQSQGLVNYPNSETDSEDSS